jgi:hypothetical protein
MFIQLFKCNYCLGTEKFRLSFEINIKKVDLNMFYISDSFSNYKLIINYSVLIIRALRIDIKIQFFICL